MAHAGPQGRSAAYSRPGLDDKHGKQWPMSGQNRIRLGATYHSDITRLACTYRTASGPPGTR